MQHILVMDTGGLGLLSYVRLADQGTPGASFLASQVAMAFDQTLAAVLSQASDLSIFDTFDFIDNTVASGAFANVIACGARSNADCSSACSGTASTSAPPATKRWRTRCSPRSLSNSQA